jgi:hypothetical protein
VAIAEKHEADRVKLEPCVLRRREHAVEKDRVVVGAKAIAGNRDEYEAL